MSDLALFIVGCAVFAIATAAVLLYGYLAFYAAGLEDGLERDRVVT